uniref:Protein swallow n=1 Tax=Glossina austeni TaxID=7395 RepID=A0A1A9UFT6_GLOAU
MSIQDESVPPDFDLDCSAVRDNVNQSTSLPVNDKYELTTTTNACSSSEISGQTNASEPADAAESTNKRPAYSRNTPSKAFSYQDIHSEYTKKRFKHVESKVAQYIAHMKVQDAKRRNSQQFLRYRSLPETLGESREQHLNIINTSQKFMFPRHNAGDANNRPAQKNESASESLKHVDKDTYAQLLSDKERNDYLQSKLDEKNAENWRLKRNIDYMRFELTQCKDKLQQTTVKLQNAQALPDSYGRVSALGMEKRQLWQCRSDKFTKATQTDLPLSPSTTPDSNNNGYDYKGLGVRAPLVVKMPKIVTTIQPISLNFGSATEREKHDHDLNTTMNVLRQSSHDLSTRKRLELACSGNKAPNHFIDSFNTSSHLELTTSSEGVAATQQHQTDQDQLMHHTNCLQYLNYDKNGNANADSIYATDESKLSIMASDGAGKARSTRKRRSLHSRMVRLFRSCIRCNNSNHTLDSTSNNQRQQQSYTQIPLLEKSFKNYCRNEHRAAV